MAMSTVRKADNADAVGLLIKCQKRTFPLNDRRLEERKEHLPAVSPKPEQVF